MFAYMYTHLLPGYHLTFNIICSIHLYTSRYRPMCWTTDEPHGRRHVHDTLMHVGHSQPALQATSWPKICRNRLPGMAHTSLLSFQTLSLLFVGSQHTLDTGKSLFTHTYSHNTHKKDTTFTGHLASGRLHEIINGCWYNRLLLSLGHTYVYVLLDLQCVHVCTTIPTGNWSATLYVYC